MSIHVERRGHVVLALLDDEPRRNALSTALVRELIEVIQTSRRERVRAIVIGSTGRVFCAGADISEMLGQDWQTWLDPRPESPTPLDLFETIENDPRPIIAAVDGPAIGGGVELTLACDLVLASEKANFTLPELGHGAIPNTALARLPRITGSRMALDLILTRRRVAAEEALALGLVNRLVPSEQLHEAAISLAESIVSAPPGAIAGGEARDSPDAGVAGDSAHAEYDARRRIQRGVRRLCRKATAELRRSVGPQLESRSRKRPTNDWRKSMSPWKPILVAVVASALSTLASAQAYPSKPIRMIVPYSPGGGADTTARLIAKRVSETLGQQVVVENRTGGGGAIGADFVAKAAPDGYTILFDASGIVINTALRKLPFDLVKDLTPVTLVVTAPMVLVVPPNAPYKTVAEYIQHAKSSPNKVAIASSGAGSAQHFAAELFSAAAGFGMLHVPYKGGAPAMTDVMGGQVGAYFANVASASGHIKSGKLRALGVTSAKRVATLPEVPTLAEGGVTGYNVAEWNAVFVPARTPEPIVQRLASEISSALRQPEIRQSIEQFGLEPVGNTPEQFASFIRDDIAKWTSLIKTNKIELE